MSNCQNIAERDNILGKLNTYSLTKLVKNKALIKQSKCMKMTVDCAGMVKTWFLKLIINRTLTTVNFYFFFVSLGSVSWWCCIVHQHHRIIQTCAKIFYSCIPFMHFKFLSLKCTVSRASSIKVIDNWWSVDSISSMSQSEWFNSDKHALPRKHEW